MMMMMTMVLVMMMCGHLGCITDETQGRHHVSVLLLMLQLATMIKRVMVKMSTTRGIMMAMLNDRMMMLKPRRIGRCIIDETL